MIDANVVISAALSPNGLARQAIAAARARGGIALSDDVFREVVDVLARPKFKSLLTEDDRREIIARIEAAALWFEPVETIKDCRPGRAEMPRITATSPWRLRRARL